MPQCAPQIPCRLCVPRCQVARLRDRRGRVPAGGWRWQCDRFCHRDGEAPSEDRAELEAGAGGSPTSPCFHPRSWHSIVPGPVHRTCSLRCDSWCSSSETEGRSRKTHPGGLSPRSSPESRELPGAVHPAAPVPERPARVVRGTTAALRHRHPWLRIVVPVSLAHPQFGSMPWQRERGPYLRISTPANRG